MSNTHETLLASLLNALEIDPDQVLYQEEIDSCPICLEDIGKTEKVFPGLLRKEHKNSNLGKAWAQNLLAQYYDSSNYNSTDPSIQKNDAEALRLYLLSAKQGHIVAQNNLSQMFHDGQVCEKSLKKKVYWLTLAANQGYIDAQCNLGFLILDGEIPSRSREDGMLLIQNAASRGQSYAQSRLAEEYLKESDLTSSLYWFKRAALQNYSTAQFNLAVILIKSNQEIPTAMFWLRKAAGSGYNIATKLLKKREVEIALKCGACFKSLNGTGKKCTKCKSVYYCNKNCQIKDWKESHKKDCIDEISE